MFCPYCGSQTVDGAAFCVKCGKSLPNTSNTANNISSNSVSNPTQQVVAQQQHVPPIVKPNPQVNNLFVEPSNNQIVQRIGFSNAVNDPRFISKRRNQSCIALGCSIFMIPVPFIGFWAYSQFWHGMEMSEALKVGAGVSGIFLLFYIFIWLKKIFGRQWDGVVIGLAEEEHVSRRDYHSEGSTFTRQRDYYYLYVVKIQTDSGKIKKIENRSENSYYFRYFKVGDRVRYHPDIDYYEKYDKTNDTHELCPFCNRVNPITDDVCKCGAPIIK